MAGFCRSICTNNPLQCLQYSQPSGSKPFSAVNFKPALGPITVPNSPNSLQCIFLSSWFAQRVSVSSNIVLLRAISGQKGLVSTLKEESSEQLVASWHTLPSGLRLEVLVQNACKNVKKKAPLVFIHGSYHAAWCWGVHWLPFFSSRGHDCFAVSLLGQGKSDVPSQPGPTGTIQSHADTIAEFIKHQCSGNPPVLIGHSFGGLIVQFYLSQPSSGPECSKPYPRLAGAILACSVPPTGNGPVVKRFLMSKPIASIKVTLSLAAKLFASSVSLCRETFFSPTLEESEVVRYQQLMRESSRAPLFDLRKLNGSLPVPPPASNCPPVLVVGAENDFILDREGISESAAFLDTKEVIIPGVAHDIMLDTSWREAAEVLSSWMDEKCSTTLAWQVALEMISLSDSAISGFFGLLAGLW